MKCHRALNIIPRHARNYMVGIGLAIAVTTHAFAADFQTIYQFPGGAHGVNPEAGVILGPAGSVYGTTDSDGINAGGIVFQLSPPQGAGGAWSQTILKRFINFSQGGYPLGLTSTSNGALFGVTLDGGGTRSGSGIVFRLTPSAEGTSWTFETLHRFRGGYDGALPSGSLIIDANGVLSGTTILGGAGDGTDGYGVAYSLTPPQTAPGEWTETILHRFKSSPDGATPDGTLLPLSASVLVGISTTGGTGICSNVGCGTVFRLIQTPAHGWAESIIYQFKGGADGSIPIDRLIAGANGSLYGATADGGLKGPDGHFVTGTVFRLDPPATAADSWTKTILYEFKGDKDGETPQAGVTLDESGALYGTTEFGGAHDEGTVYKLTPNAPGQRWTKVILHHFGSGAADGADPTGHVTLDASGTIFGTTIWGGEANDGTVYRITQ